MVSNLDVSFSSLYSILRSYKLLYDSFILNSEDGQCLGLAPLEVCIGV